MSAASQAGWSVSSLHIYPIKSCAGIDLTAVRFDERGPLYDRMFMLVDEAGDFLSQRKLPRMALITPRLGAMALSVTAPEMPALKLAMGGSPSDKRLTVRLRSAELEVQDVGQHAASWFSEFLRTRCRLVRMAPSAARFADAKYAGPGVELAFPDGFPALLAGVSALAAVKKRL